MRWVEDVPCFGEKRYLYIYAFIGKPGGIRLLGRNGRIT
jgi:hypothetical protein